MSKVGGSYSYNAICDVCGFQFKSHEMRKRWDGLMVCPADWEMRHPLDFYKTRDDTHKLPFIRPNDDMERPTAIGDLYEPDPAWANTNVSEAWYYNVFSVRSNCRPTAVRYYHDGMYTQANSPVLLEMWKRKDFEVSYTRVWSGRIELLPNNPGWIELPVSQANSGITFVNGDYTDYVAIGFKPNGSSPNIPLSIGGDVANTTYFNYLDSWLCVSNPNGYSSLGAVAPIDVLVKDEDIYDYVLP